MRRHKVEFEAHKTVKQETDVKFTKRDGTRVEFLANVPVKVETDVEFMAKDKPRKK